jgi:hypothetical protein
LSAGGIDGKVATVVGRRLARIVRARRETGLSRTEDDPVGETLRVPEKMPGETWWRRPLEAVPTGDRW